MDAGMPENMDLLIRPHEGVGPLALGMTKDEIEQVMGGAQEDFVRSEFARGVEWIYDSLGVDIAFDVAGTCVAIGLTAPSDPRFRSLRLLRVPAVQAWALIQDLDPSASVEGDDNLTSSILGISLYAPAIPDEEPDDPACSVLVFRRDYFAGT